MTETLFRTEPYARTCTATVLSADAAGIVLDRTVFYPTGGGQPGDTGTLETADGRKVAIANTIKGPDGGIVHVPAPGASALSPGDAVTATLDWDRRHRLMRMHTCLHLLSVLLPYPVTGGQVSDGKGRLDFDCGATLPDREFLTAELNKLVAADHPVGDIWIADDELLGNPDLVKTMAVKPPLGQGRVRLIRIGPPDSQVDLQACGGTHVARTGEIGAVAVLKIESKGRQNRRVNIGFAP